MQCQQEPWQNLMYFLIQYISPIGHSSKQMCMHHTELQIILVMLYLPMRPHRHLLYCILPCTSLDNVGHRCMIMNSKSKLQSEEDSSQSYGILIIDEVKCTG